MGVLAIIQACTPTDRPLNSSNPSNSGFGSGSSGNRDISAAREDSDRQIVYLVQRAGEASALIAHVIHPDLARTALGISMQGLPGEAGNLLSQNILLENEAIKIFGQKTHEIIIEKAEDGVLKSLKIVSRGDFVNKRNFTRKTDQANITIKNSIESITAKPLVGRNGFSVEMFLADEINMKIGKTRADNSLSFEVLFADSLEQMSIEKLKVKQNRDGASEDKFDYEPALSPVSVAVSGPCLKLTGAVKLNSVDKNGDRPKYSREISLKEDGAVVSSGKKQVAVAYQSCEQRSLVDISMILF